MGSTLRSEYYDDKYGFQNIMMINTDPKKILWSGLFLWSEAGKEKSVLAAQSYLILCNPMDYSLPGFSVHGDSPGKNTGVGCHALLQGIFSTQGSNLVLKAIYILYKTCGSSTNILPQLRISQTCI